MNSQLMLLIIIGMFVVLAVVGYLFEADEETPTAPAPEADHDHH